MKLLVDEDELAACVACGLCLPHCPTYRVTGEEAASPRGRIAAMRSVHAGAPADSEFTAFMGACVQCRGCEAACPSGVPFGRLMEGTRATLARRQARRSGRRLMLRALGHHRLLVAGSRLLAVAQRARLVPARLGLPPLPLSQPALMARRTGGEPVWLFPGCVMDAWMRSTHQAVVRVLEAAGAEVMLPSSGGDCCGALATHAGWADDGTRLLRRSMAGFPGTAPVLVDSAGCGAQLKEAAERLGTAESVAFAARVLDVHEWLAPRMSRFPGTKRVSGSPGARKWESVVVAVQDPCHLRHVQRAHLPVRRVLEPFFAIAELDDDGLCCGAGGAYAAEEPEMAAAIRDRKLGAIARSGATVVASANPGCLLHLRAAGVEVRHPCELVDEVLDGR
ncbi:MAG TPA: (Fe-S)-binding protein [Acidimicrobiales bacterium]|nr:(Fe-S)-binding protein [Acidimicrobiales bacterium]